MENKPIVIAPPGNLSVKDKKRLEKEGYIVIESNLPSSVKIIDRPAVITQQQVNKITLSAIKALAEASYSSTDSDGSKARTNFVRELSKYLHEADKQS